MLTLLPSPPLIKEELEDADYDLEQELQLLEYCKRNPVTRHPGLLTRPRTLGRK